MRPGSARRGSRAAARAPWATSTPWDSASFEGTAAAVEGAERVEPGGKGPSTRDDESEGSRPLGSGSTRDGGEATPFSSPPPPLELASSTGGGGCSQRWAVPPRSKVASPYGAGREPPQ